MVPVTPKRRIPRSCAAASLPVSSGSSEKYSKFLPFKGLRWILRPGPRSVSTRFLRCSLPCMAKSSSFSFSLKVQASKVPFGRLNAMVPQSIRMPEGPSAQQAVGIPKLTRFSVTPPNAPAVPAVTFGEFMPSPRIRQMRSSSESCATKSSSSALPSNTSPSLMPLSPVYGFAGFNAAALRTAISYSRCGAGSNAIVLL